LATQKEKPRLSPTHVFLIGGNPPAIEIVFQSSRGPTNRHQRPAASSFKKNTLTEIMPEKKSRKHSCQQQQKHPVLYSLKPSRSRSDQRSFSHPQQCQHPEISISFLSCRTSLASSFLDIGCRAVLLLAMLNGCPRGHPSTWWRFGEFFATTIGFFGKVSGAGFLSCQSAAKAASAFSSSAALILDQQLRRNQFLSLSFLQLQQQLETQISFLSSSLQHKSSRSQIVSIVSRLLLSLYIVYFNNVLTLIISVD